MLKRCMCTSTKVRVTRQRPVHCEPEPEHIQIGILKVSSQISIRSNQSKSQSEKTLQSSCCFLRTFTTAVAPLRSARPSPAAAAVGQCSYRACAVHSAADRAPFLLPFPLPFPLPIHSAQQPPHTHSVVHPIRSDPLRSRSNWVVVSTMAFQPC